MTKSSEDRERHLKVVREGLVKRFVITHVNGSGSCKGMRRLTFAMQGRNTHATREEAERLLALYKEPGSLDRVLKPAELATLEVREWDCYPGHHDPVRYYE